MGDAARHEDEVTRPRLPLLVPAVDLDGALEQVERLVLAVVAVQRRPEPRGRRPFEEGEGAVRLLPAGLDAHPRVQEPHVRTVLGAQHVALRVEAHTVEGRVHAYLRNSLE